MGTSFDPKEELFRNFPGIIGPLSDIVLRHEWGEGPEVKVTIAYIDPANYIAASYEITVKGEDRVLSHKPDFTLPLRPGLWRVKVLYLWEEVVETGFVVLPMTYIYGKKISVEQAEDLNNGPEKNSYVNRNFVDMESMLGLKNTEKLRAQSRENGKLLGDKLDAFVDSLMKKTWRISETCVVGNMEKCSKFPQCKSTEWSSQSPDPKSQIFGIDKESGHLIRTR